MNSLGPYKELGSSIIFIQLKIGFPIGFLLGSGQWEERIEKIV
jgi:hypothetical protein